MESKGELKEIDIKNRTYYYFDDRDIDIGFSNILLNEKSYKTYINILIYDISYKTYMGSKPLCIRFHEIDGFIKIYDRIRYLLLFGSKLHNAIYNRIRYLISEKSGITDSINHNFATIKIDSVNSLPAEKPLTFHNVVILFKSVVNKNKNNYYYNIFFKKGSCEDKSNTRYF